MVVGAVATDLIETVALEVNGAVVETTLTSAEDSGIPHFIVEGRVTQTWDEPHSRLILRVAQTLPWKSVDKSSTDSTEFGIAIQAITISSNTRRD
jgi:hypothetical protein